MAASEMAPLARTGGLGDVLEALPAELQRRGHEVSVILPYYRPSARTRRSRIEPTGVMMTVEVGARQIETEILEARGAKRRADFLRAPGRIFRPLGNLRQRRKAYEDNAERFIFFSKAAVELARRRSPRAGHRACARLADRADPGLHPAAAIALQDGADDP